MLPKAIPVERGCGTRKQGGIYAEFGCGPGGSPIEDFLVDPPIVINPQDLGLTPVGVRLVERDGVWHILDWVGSESYPNVADYVEETRRAGLSRRLAKTLDFSKLTEQSRILLVHARAHTDVFHLYADRWTGLRYNRCPKNIEAHSLPDYPDMCAGFWWEDVTGASADPILQTYVLGRSMSDQPRAVIRRMPSFTYAAAAQPDDFAPAYRPAIFASFPIHRLVVIKGKHGEHKAGIQAASQSSLPVQTEDR